MKKSIFINTILTFLILSITACAQESYKSITVEELQKQIATDSTLIVLDVRSPQELNGPLGQISGVINIPVQNLAERIDEMKKYKDHPIAVICRSGNRSGIATPILIKNHYNAANVLGGMIAWNKMITSKSTKK